MLKVGEKVRFAEEKQAYTVQAVGDRYAVCTKPFNLRRTVLYSIVDFKKKIRGTENLIFCNGFETRQQCEDALFRLELGDTEVSSRTQIPLHITPRRERSR